MSEGDPRLMVLTPQYKKRGFFDFRRRSIQKWGVMMQLMNKFVCFCGYDCKRLYLFRLIKRGPFIPKSCKCKSAKSFLRILKGCLGLTFFFHSKKLPAGTR